MKKYGLSAIFHHSCLNVKTEQEENTAYLIVEIFFLRARVFGMQYNFLLFFFLPFFFPYFFFFARIKIANEKYKYRASIHFFREIWKNYFGTFSNLIAIDANFEIGILKEITRVANCTTLHLFFHLTFCLKPYSIVSF